MNIIKKLLLLLFLLFTNFTYTVVIRYGSIAILPYKVTSYSDNHKKFSTDVSELLTTRFAYSSNLTVRASRQVLPVLKTMGLINGEYSIDSVIALSRRLNVNYFIMGELIIKQNETIMKSKLVQIEKNTAVILSKAFFSASDYSNYELADLAEKNAVELSKNRIPLNLNLGEKYINNADFDIMFVVDSSEKNQEEINFLGKNISHIYSRLCYINPKANIRIGITSFKNRADIYRARMLNFTNDIIKVRRYLNDVHATGGKEIAGIDVSYALYYSIVRGKWRAGNRIVYLITSDKPSDVPDKYQFSEIIKKARLQNIVVNILGTSELPYELRSYYTAMALYTRGRYHDIIYNISYYIDRQGKRQFIYKHHYLFMLKNYAPERKWMLQSVFNDRNAQDITLGRIIPSIKDVRIFLEKEGFRISSSFDSETNKTDMDIDYIIENSMKSKLERTFKKLIRLTVYSGTRQFYVYVGNNKAINYLNRNLRVGSTVLIGGAVKPSKTETGFDFDPKTLILTQREDFIANILIRTPNEIGSFPKLYAASGIFDNKIWFIKARIINIRN